MDPKVFTISKAAELLKVHTNTLRNWEVTGQLIPTRGKNNYRYYSIKQLQKYLSQSFTPKTETVYGYKKSLKELKNEIETSKTTINIIVSSNSSTDDVQDDLEVMQSLLNATKRGVRVQIIRDTRSSFAKVRKKNFQIKKREVLGLKFSVIDSFLVKINIPSDNPRRWITQVIKDDKTGKVLTEYFAELWSGQRKL